MEFSKWTTRKEVESGNLPNNSFPVDVSITAKSMSIFDPLFPHGDIPLPEMIRSKGLKSDTVQGVWEALAVVNGTVDSSCFHGTPRRNISPNGLWAFGGKKLTWEDARQAIYIPTYIWMFDNKIPEDIKIAFYHIAKTGVIIYFYDNSENPDPIQRTNDFSHAFLVHWCMNRDFKKMQQADTKMQGLMSFSSNMDFSDLPDIAKEGGINWDKVI